MYLYDNISLNSFKNEKCFRQICRENQNTRCIFNYFLFPENHTVYEVMWKKYGRDGQRQITIQYGACAMRA